MPSGSKRTMYFDNDLFFLLFQELPPPGSYNVDKAYKNSQGKRDAGNPRNDSAKRKQGAFKSSSSRFAPPRDVVLEETDPSNPGKFYTPSSATPHLRLTKASSLISLRSPAPTQKSPAAATRQLKPNPNSAYAQTALKPMTNDQLQFSI